MYKMKKILFTIICALMAFASNAQDLNSKGDNILGNYLSIKDGGKSKIKITKAEDKNRRVRKRKTEREEP
jgi:predicted RNA-binding protein with RPS1 domain